MRASVLWQSSLRWIWQGVPSVSLVAWKVGVKVYQCYIHYPEHLRKENVKIIFDERSAPGPDCSRYIHTGRKHRLGRRVEWRFDALSASKAIFKGRTYIHNFFQSGDDDYLMIEPRRKPTTGTRCLTVFNKWHRFLYTPSRTDTAGHTKVFDYPVTQTPLDIPRPLITQSHRHGWTYQGLWLPSHTDTAGHTKVFDYPVTQTRLDIPRSLITQSHRHGWTYQGLWLPSHTDTAGHTKVFDFPVTQTRLDIPRSLITQSHRHGWTYQGLWLPSHTDTAGHTKVFDYPVTQTRLDIPRPLITQSHRHGWTYQGLWLPSHTDTAGHTKTFDYPVTQTRLDIPRPLITPSWTTGEKSRQSVFWCDADLNQRPVGPESNTLTTRPPEPPIWWVMVTELS